MDAATQVSTGEIASASAMKRSSIRTATFDDYDGIAAVETRNGLTAKPREQWLDLWLANPAYHQLRRWPIGWVIQDQDGAIVGSLGNIPSLFYFENSRFVASAGRGWAVDAEYRQLSIMLLAQQIKFLDADMNLVTTPGPVTAALCTRLGWSRMPVGEWDRSEFWVLNYASAVRKYLAVKAPRPLGALANLVTAPLRRTPIRPWRHSRSAVPGCSLEWCTEFDQRFNVLWDELQRQRPDRLLAVRDARTLAWHFKHALLRNQLWILTASMDGRLAGYAILERRDVPAFGLTRVVLIDLQVCSKQPEMCSNMLDAVRDRCLDEGIDVIENLGCWLRELQPIGRPPHHRKLDWWSHLYRITNPQLKVSRSAWYPTQYDGDASL